MKKLFFLILLFSWSIGVADSPEEETCLTFAILPPFNECYEQTPFFSSASFIFWQGKMYGLDFAVVSEDPSFGFQNLGLSFNAKGHSPDFAWKPGAKIEFGYTFPYDGWDTLVGWTYFHDKLTDKRRSYSQPTTPEGEGVYAIWDYPFFQNFNFFQSILYENAHNYWNLVFNSWDWEWGRNFSVNDWLALRLHAGIKTGYLRQTYKVHYDTGTLLGPDINTLISTSLKFLSSDMISTNRFWGIGPRCGVDSKWKLGQGFHFIADSSFSLVPSFFHVRSNFNDLVIDLEDKLASGLLPLQAKIRENFLDFIPVFQALLGVDWGMCFGQCSQFYMSLSAGYEVQYWWNVNQTRRGISAAVPGFQYNSHGDWKMQGLTGTINFEY